MSRSGNEHARGIIGSPNSLSGTVRHLPERDRAADPGAACEVAKAIEGCVAGYVSVFAGRVADKGHDPVPIMAEAVRLLARYPQLELIWAGPRELLNIFQAEQVGCHIITTTADIRNKLCIIGKDLAEYSLETVKMFLDDAVKAGYSV
jgi:transaldolase